MSYTPDSKTVITTYYPIFTRKNIQVKHIRDEIGDNFYLVDTESGLEFFIGTSAPAKKIAEIIQYILELK